MLTVLVTPASSIPNTLDQHTGESYAFLHDSFFDPPLNQEDDVVIDPNAFPNAFVIENMIYEPGNIDWVCSSQNIHEKLADLSCVDHLGHLHIAFPAG